MIEKNIENKITQLLKDQKIYWLKIHGGQYQVPGIPDLLICYRGFFMAIEVKKDPNKPTKIQWYHLDEIKKSFGLSLIVSDSNLEEFKTLILKESSYEDFIQFSNQCHKLFKR